MKSPHLPLSISCSGVSRGVEIDTAFFTGNQVPRFSIAAAELPSDAADGTQWLPGTAERAAKGGGVQGTAATPEDIDAASAAVSAFAWHELVPVTPLRPGYKDRCVHFIATPGATQRATHLRLNYFPDGGVARLRIWGDVSRDFATELASAPGPIDLAAVENGGKGRRQRSERSGHVYFALCCFIDASFLCHYTWHTRILLVPTTTQELVVLTSTTECPATSYNQGGALIWATGGKLDAIPTGQL